MRWHGIHMSSLPATLVDQHSAMDSILCAELIDQASYRVLRSTSALLLGLADSVSSLP